LSALDLLQRPLLLAQHTLVCAQPILYPFCRCWRTTENPLTQRP
jgi:hypothetical protein